MKNIFFNILFILLLSCGDDSNPFSPAEYSYFGAIAYNSLTEADKESLLIGSKPSNVEEGTYNKSNGSNLIILDNHQILHFFITNENIKIQINKKLVAVFFNTKNDSLLGPIIIIIDRNTETVVGSVGRL